MEKGDLVARLAQTRAMNFRTGAGLLLVTLMAGVSMPAIAQDIPAAAGPAPRAGNALDEIVVTAQRREENLQSVPIAVQAFSGEVLEERNVQDVVDLQRLVPALTTYQQARDEATLSIRGLSSSGASAQGQNPRVTTYFAQVPLQTGDNGGPGRFFDLANVQVLKGPQGTLFGRNSTGGAVLYEPRRPTFDFNGYAIAQFGRFNDRELEGAVNVPLSETLAVRVAAKGAKRDGFTKNIVTGQELDNRNYVGVRGSVLFQPSDVFDNYLVVDYLRSKTNGSSQQIGGIDPDKVLTGDVLGGRVPGVPALPLTLGGNGPSPGGLATDFAGTLAAAIAAGRFSFAPDPVLQNQLANQLAMGPRISQSLVDGLNFTKAWSVTNITTVQLSDLVLVRNIFGLRRFKQRTRYDLDGTALPLLDQVTDEGWTADLRQITDELQFQGQSANGRLTYVLGGFLLTQKSPKMQVLEQISVGGNSLSLSKPKEESESLFVHATYDLSEILLSGLSVTGGYRYTHDYRGAYTSNFRGATCGLIRGCPSLTEASSTASSYNFTLEYQINPSVMVYASHRKSFRSGGVNPQALDFGMAYGPERVQDYEGGLKAEFEIGQMSARTNFAAFYAKLKDAQVSQAFSTVNELTGQLSLINLIVNAATATIKGFEVDMLLVPVEGLNLSLAYAYTDGKYDEFINLATGLNEDNRPFPFLAKNRLNLGASYTLPLSERIGSVSFGANYAISSKYTLSVFDDPYGVENGYQQLDLRLDWRNVSESNVSLGAFVNNVTNEVYKIGGVPILSVLGTTSLLYSEPRTWGIQLRYDF